MTSSNQTIDFDFRPDCSMHNFALSPGKYLFEAWGAAGGSKGGKGAKTIGIISFSVKTNIFVVVGEKGFDENFDAEPARSTCGGGGRGGLGMNDTKKFSNGASGGGATSVMIHEATLENRILVSAGGGSGHGIGGGNAGGLKGGNAQRYSFISYGANQTFGFMPGIGENGRDAAQSRSGDAEGGGGAGGGYFGGTTTNLTIEESSIGGGGGSSYISGHPGCLLNPLAKFTKPILFSGGERFSLPDNTYANGNTGNGFFRITILSELQISCDIQRSYHNILLYITPMILLIES